MFILFLMTFFVGQAGVETDRLILCENPRPMLQDGLSALRVIYHGATAFSLLSTRHPNPHLPHTLSLTYLLVHLYILLLAIFLTNVSFDTFIIPFPNSFIGHLIIYFLIT